VGKDTVKSNGGRAAPRLNEWALVSGDLDGPGKQRKRTRWTGTSRGQEAPRIPTVSVHAREFATLVAWAGPRRQGGEVFRGLKRDGREVKGAIRNGKDGNYRPSPPSMAGRARPSHRQRLYQADTHRRAKKDLAITPRDSLSRSGCSAYAVQHSAENRSWTMSEKRRPRLAKQSHHYQANAAEARRGFFAKGLYPRRLHG